ncbi:OsmC family peroxiredoxin [Labilibaculum sp. K2S]|uniref:OsmC family peroxiredoxin n=1 Tax=Labilibaculum sp. K2S TaxID=3056386 RepID=UPI0025A395EC|nr:OsmC family peroxiredoxin [Labilibaculum sp. K2S]MDM8159609.1 OsmC family peroxiredoxin [Labilibaculum sp. K2S]
MKRTATANWQGNIKEGKGTLSTQSGILDKTNYSFKTRFEEGEKGTNPEELLATAHAGCFTMSVASILDKKGLSPDKLDTKASLTLEGLSITAIHLSIKGSVKDMNADAFATVVKEAEQNCIVSKVLKVAITSESHLET